MNSKVFSKLHKENNRNNKNDFYIFDFLFVALILFILCSYFIMFKYFNFGKHI